MPFSYSDFDDSLPGYNRSESHGGLLHAGLSVRLHYTSNRNNSILQIEVPSSISPSPPLMHSHSESFPEGNDSVRLVVIAMCALALAFMSAYAIVVRRYKAAVRDGSATRMRRLANWIVRVNPPLMRVLVDIDILLVEESWSEALRRLDDVPANAPEQVQLSCDNNRAWCLLQSGNAEAALALAEKVCASSLEIPAARRASCEGTRAIALLLCGRVSEALPALEKAVKAPAPSNRSLSTRWYYLAEARRALDRADAMDAYRRACDVDPLGPWGKRAQARLAGHSDAYR